MTWEEAIEHPSLRDLPFKIELNGDGNLVMIQRRVSQGGHQARVAFLLRERLPQGRVIISAGILTADNVKVADVAWFTAEHWQAVEHEAACSTAPAICVEVTSKSDYQRELSVKKALYFEAGAQEVWFCDKFGNMSFFTPAGPAVTSPMCPDFPGTV